jgi:chromosome partitioning protein
MRTIAIVNQKGGCGKTITAINLSAFLAREGCRVLLVDMDPQGHATLGLVREDPSRSGQTLYDVLTRPGETPLKRVLLPAGRNLDVAPSDIRLSALSEQLAGAFGREDRLREALDPVREDYDYAIVDCPPGIGLLTFNALKACSEAIIPVEPSFFSLHGIGRQIETLELLARQTGHRVQPRALITLYTGRSDFVKAVAEDIRRHLGERCFATVIRYSAKLSEAAGHAAPITAFSPRSNGYADYLALAREILAQEQPDAATAAEAEGEEAAVPAPDAVPALVRLGASPPVRTAEGVLFTLEAPQAHCVQLAADFNGWVPDGNEMQVNGTVWKKLVPLPPGRYHYRFVVDGGWITDPLNHNVELMPSGLWDSVINVEGSPNGVSH